MNKIYGLCTSTVKTLLTSINLRLNNLGSEGAKALAPAIRDSPSVTSVGKDGLNLKNNSLGAEGWGAILTAVCSSAVSKIASIDASGEDIGSKGAKLIAEALRNSVNTSVTSVCAFGNSWSSRECRGLCSLPIACCVG